MSRLEQEKKLQAVIKSESDKTTEIIKNVLIMLSNRIFLEKTGAKKKLLEIDLSKDLTKQNGFVDDGNNTFIVNALSGEKYALKIIYQELSAPGKQAYFTDFFKDYPSHKKILVVSKYNNKVYEYATKNYSQIFLECVFLQDIISHRDQPKFELLTPAEMEMVKTEYNMDVFKTKKILKSDPVSRYFALKKGDIIRIIRPSVVSGESIDYRIVA